MLSCIASTDAGLSRRKQGTFRSLLLALQVLRSSIANKKISRCVVRMAGHISFGWNLAVILRSLTAVACQLLV